MQPKILNYFLIVSQDQVDAAVKGLLSLKADFKAACGKDWKPGMVVPGASAPAPAAPAASVAPSSGGDANKVRFIKYHGLAPKQNQTNMTVSVGGRQ